MSSCAAGDTGGPTSVGTVDDPPVGDRATLTRVLDGDSIAVRLADGSPNEVRLIGINAPEGDECHGEAARTALSSTLGNNQLTLVADGAENDQFGRLLRYVYSGGVNANLEMVSSGHALAVQSGHRLEGVFVEAAIAAAVTGIGLWSPMACGDNPRLAAIEISEIEFDPPGRDSDNPNEEWVRIVNREDQPVDLSGWVLRDESTRHRLVLPDGLQLGPGGGLTIHSGCGTATATDLYWCATDPVWSNGGDTVILQLPDGTIVAWEQYAGDY
jgi:micrococcal nuclease